MGKSLWQRIVGLGRRSDIGSRRFGPYEIVRVIHDGEKAVVYQARSPGDDQLYAVKAYKPLYNRTARRICKRYSLRNEGEIGMFLNPPDGAPADDYPLVRTVTHGMEFDDPARCRYIVQEFVEGVNVKHMIGCADPMLRKRRLEIAQTLGKALAIIHDRGLVHRDVCTDNILLPRNGPPKLIDLGFTVPCGIRFPEKSGTPSYMSPEQITARPLEPASDIYSFGVVLFELFTTELPLKSRFPTGKPDVQVRRVSDLMDKHIHEQPPRPSEIAHDLPDGIEKIIMRCLEKAPTDRYPAARTILVGLSHIRDKESKDQQDT